ATLYTLLTAQVPIPSTLRNRVALPAPRDLRPELSPEVNQAVMQGMAVEAQDRPSSVAAWLALLPHPLPPAAMASPGMAQSIPTTAATFAVSPVARSPQPGVVSTPAAIPAAATRSRTPLILGLVAIGSAIAAALASVWFQQQTEPTSSATRTEVASSAASPATPSSAIAPIAASPTASPVPSSPTPSPAAIASPAVEASPDVSPTASPEASPATSPAASASPAPQQSTSVPGLPTGLTEQEVIAQLGQPTQTTKNAYWPNTRSALYELVPNQVTLGYIYDKTSNRLRQSEVSFAPSVDASVMQTTLSGMLGNVPAAVAQGLSQVQQRQSNQYAFQTGQLKGIIERNDRDRIYIGVWDADLH
ncbi:MAG TPA: hypothetical protein V6C57_21330, partial [Coleofasciculaceae cyanobacterium]